MINWPSYRNPIKETMKAMEKLVKDNLIKFIGVSNFDIKELQQAQLAQQNERITCNQVLYHLDYRAIEKRIARCCKSKKIAVVGYIPHLVMMDFLLHIVPRRKYLPKLPTHMDELRGRLH
jgi:diketogulonate reductase-like aldo/keto reductase